MKKDRIKKLLLVIYIFLVLYFPPILNINMLFYTCIITVLYFIFISIIGKKIIIDYYTISLMGILILLIVWEIVLGRFNGVGIEHSANDLILIILGAVFSSIMIKNICINSNFSNNDLLEMILVAGVIQSILSIIAYIFTPFQMWFIDRMINYGYSDSRFTQLSSFRWYGVATQLGFATPAVQVVFSLICLYKAIANKEKKCYIPALLLLFSAAINARLSIVLLFLGFIVLLCTILNGRFTTEVLIRIILVLIGTLIIGIILLKIMKTIAYSNYNWLVNGILDFFGINVDTENVYAIGNYFIDKKNMILPSGESLLVGYGTSPVNLSFVKFSTDLGFVLDVWKFGLILTIAIYIGITKACSRLNMIGFSKDKFLFRLIIIWLLVCNIKGNVISATPISFLFVILICAFPKYEKTNWNE